MLLIQLDRILKTPSSVARIAEVNGVIQPSSGDFSASRSFRWHCPKCGSRMDSKGFKSPTKRVRKYRCCFCRYTTYENTLIRLSGQPVDGNPVSKARPELY